MKTDRRVFISIFRGPQHIFQYWSMQIEVILKAHRVWPVVRDNDGESSSSSLQVRESYERSDVVSVPGYARNLECSIIPKGLVQMLFPCGMWYQEYAGRCGGFCMTNTARRPLSVQQM